jgi:RNA polymerase sigma-70 factor (ECF subfamily)
MADLPDNSSIFVRWVDEHRGILLRMARAFAPTLNDAADLQQEFLLQLWRTLPNYAGQAKPSTWVYRVCLNTALTWRRGRQRRESRIAPDVDMALVPSDSVSPAERADQGERLEKLYEAIHALPATSRTVVLLSLEGLSYREIAEVTGMTEDHIGVVLTHGRKRLAENLEDMTHELG